MTTVAFHFGLPDKLHYACRLVRKALAHDSTLILTAEPELLQRLDLALWTFEAGEFLPHCLLPANAALLAASPVLLSAQPEAAPQRQLLVNLGAALPQGFAAFERVFELVSLEPADRQAARQRWRQYQAQGCTITQHDVSQKGNP